MATETHRLTPEEIRESAKARLRNAMVHIERAQNELDRACQELSPITWGDPLYTACGKIRERVHTFWYRVKNFRDTNKKYGLDASNIEALAKQIAALRAPPSQPLNGKLE